MKKISILVFGLCLPMLSQAQSAFDALRYSQNFYTGTARSAAMGNALTAVGGDFGSLSINPAGSAVYTYSEVMFTPSLHIANTKSDYLGNSSSESRTRFGLTNFGYIGSYETGNTRGILNFNFGIGYNQLNNFTNRFSAYGGTDQSSWLSSLAVATDGIQATSMDMTESDPMGPFYNSNAQWKSILAWNTSLLDTLAGTGGTQYKAANELIDGDNNIYIPGRLNQNYYSQSSGSVGEYLINAGLNFSDRLFFGVNIGIQSIWYDYSESYSEAADRAQDFSQTKFDNFTHYYNQTTNGIGVNVKFGLIVLPFNNLRLGASISTPTWMSLTDEWDESMSARFSDGYSKTLYSPVGEYDYKINTPFKWNVGAAYTFGKFGALSADYERVAYQNIKMKGGNSQNVFQNENRFIGENFQAVNNFRAGLEILFQELAFRGGYNYYGNPDKYQGSETHLGSVGIGYRANGFFMDLTYMQRFAQKWNFSLYDDIYDGDTVAVAAPVGQETSSNWKVLLSIGFRF